jgi:polyphosphate kinase
VAEQASSALLASAASDPDVVAIKQILVSTSGPAVQALVSAAESGKDVLVVVTGGYREGLLATRGNDALTGSGALVVRPLVATLSLSERTLVVRRESDGLHTYVAVALSSGGDSVLSGDAQLGQEVSGLFNVLTGYGRQTA